MGFKFLPEKRILSSILVPKYRFLMSSSPPSKITKMSSQATEDTHLTIPTTKTIEELKENVKKPTATPADEKEKDGFNRISNDGTILKFKKLSGNATTPMRGSRNAAGFDLFSAETKEIPANGHGIVKTDILVILPKGTYGRVAPRSGLAATFFIDIGGGVVDSDYRGNVGVVLFNHLGKAFEVKKGDRIAQFIVEKICTPELVEVEELDETDRGA